MENARALLVLSLAAEVEEAAMALRDRIDLLSVASHGPLGDPALHAAAEVLAAARRELAGAEARVRSTLTVPSALQRPS